MIPILYDYSEKRFITNGIGRLRDCISCVVTEERNGVYELEFDYPITGEHYADIVEGQSVIGVTHDESGDIQPFDVYARSAPIDGVVTFYAHHISYRLANMVVMPFTATSLSEAMALIPRYTQGLNAFTYWTDKTTTGDYAVEVPTAIRGMLGGQENSLLDVYGSGDYEFDRFTVKLHANRGTNSGVTIRYGKNLTDITDRIDTSGSYNAVVPYYVTPDGEVVTLPETMLVYSGATRKTATLTEENLLILRDENNAPIELAYRTLEVLPMDLSDEFEETPTEDELRAAAEARFNNSRAWLPSENIEVDFMQLWQSPEYEAFAPLQRVRLCDTVSVYYEDLGVEAVEEKVIKTVWNVLLDRYDSIELGQLSTTLADAISGTVEAAIYENVPTYDALTGMFDLIRGGLGGYVYLKPNANGKPEEILIMDEPDIADAVNIIRMNKNGIGFSQNGYNGPFNSAWTIDGTFYADWIKAGIISDAAGLNSWNMNTGALVTNTLRAIQYLYVNGNTQSYFKIPYKSDSDDYYLELSSAGFRISVLNSEISDSYDNVATTAYPLNPNGLVGSLKWSFTDGMYDWETQVAPYGILIGVLDGGSTYAYINISPSEISYQANGSDIFYANPQSAAFGVPLFANSNFTCAGTKSRRVETDHYEDRLLYCYETPTPMFGDIGEAVIDEDGLCYVDLDDIFGETIYEKGEYQVFLQKEGAGDCWVSEKGSRFFVIEGTPNLKVAWELKAKQKGYQNIRLEQPDNDLDVYEFGVDVIDDYIKEQEDLLYGDN